MISSVSAAGRAEGRATTRWDDIMQDLFGRLRDGAQGEWHRYTHHPFVLRLADGTLEPERFRRFLIQDYLFLLQYARAGALAIHKSDDVAAMRLAAEGVSTLLAVELPLHVGFCAEWGLDETRLAQEEPSIELLAYGGFLLDRAQSGDLLDLQVALAACLVGYGEIGARLLSDPATRLDGNPFRAWIETYGGEKYQAVAQDGRRRLDALGEARGAEARFGTLLRDFRLAVRLEAAFWDAGSRDAVPVP
ncbi:TenA family protein [Rhizosaccharibacter radicis]|uniref:TenA family protein n=1 Tax=Rhizosaccharibacter radicis TaxID=2782605 RepID=A0ABT1VUX5_9PROT|nr:TenA family protein [Acetobacteraceae bacterium KSS12]